MIRMMVELTNEQREQLNPMFCRVAAHNEINIDADCALGAQVFPDGMHVKFFEGEQARALASALGGTFDVVSSAKQSVNEALKTDIAKGIQRDSNAAINFALDKSGSEGMTFLACWREGAWDEISKNWPEFKI